MQYAYWNKIATAFPSCDSRASRARERSFIAQKTVLSIHMRNFGSHVTVRASTRSSASQGNQYMLNLTLSS